MLLINENDVFEISVYLTEDGQNMVFHDVASAPIGAKHEIFVFRRPNWSDTKNINSTALVLDASGSPKLDLYRYMDLKVKTLLKDWSLKSSLGEKLPVTASNMNKLHPDLFQHLFTKLEEQFTVSKPKA